MRGKEEREYVCVHACMRAVRARAEAREEKREMWYERGRVLARAINGVSRAMNFKRG